MTSPSYENVKNNLPALLIALLFGLGAASLLFFSFGLLLLGFSALTGFYSSDDPGGIIILSSGIFLLAVLLLPGFYFNLLKFLNKPPASLPVPKLGNAVIVLAMIILWFASLGLGLLATKNSLLSALVLPIINIFAVCLPVIFYVWVSLHGLDLPSVRLSWTVFGATLVVSPALALIFECVVVLAIILFLSAFSSLIPGLPNAIKVISSAYKSGYFDEKQMAQIFGRLFLSPPITISLIGTFSVLVPIIEESLKTILIWPLIARIRRADHGFALGILCGAAFALTENIGFVSAGSSDWITSLATRATAAIPHILNSGILGWALVSAWNDKRFWRLAGAFLTVIAVHGLWNALSLALAMNDLSSMGGNFPIFLQSSLPWLISWIVLALGAFLGLIFNYYQIRKMQNLKPA